MSGEDRVAERIFSALEDNIGAVWGDAFERHGEILEIEDTSIQFVVTLEFPEVTIETVTTARDSCLYCGNGPTTFRQAVLADPVADDGEYVIVQPQSHEVITCPKCEYAGEIVCPNCDGNGRTTCSTCARSGVVLEASPCPICINGTTDDPDKDCYRCGGSGEVETEVTCGSCRGEGHVTCSECDAEGTTVCDRCVGVGKVHRYETRVLQANRRISTHGMPAMWEGSCEELVDEFEFDRRDVHDEDITDTMPQLSLEPIDGTAVKLQYGDDEHHLLLVDTPGYSTEYVWDPETSYPATSLTRKASDLVSRIF